MLGNWPKGSTFKSIVGHFGKDTNSLSWTWKDWKQRESLALLKVQEFLVSLSLPLYLSTDFLKIRHSVFIECYNVSIFLNFELG